MLRFFFSIALLVFLSFPSTGQIASEGLPHSSAAIKSLNQIAQINMPSFDLERMRKEDEQTKNDKSVLFRFGREFDVDIDFFKEATSEKVEEGTIYRLKIHSAKAKSINLIYSQWKLPPNAEFYLYNPSKTSVLGAFTSSNNKRHGKFSTGFVYGETTVLEYFEPEGTDNLSAQAIIRISKVVHGYRGMAEAKSGFGDSGPCNNNVNCPEFSDWADQKNSVAMIVVGGSRNCTGAVLNNVREDGTPFFLSANHCLEGDVDTWLFMFNYQSPGCEDIDGPTDQSVSGATVLSNTTASDFLLLQLSESIPESYNVFFSGWSLNAPIGPVTTIHHPQGDIKKISFDEDGTDFTGGSSSVPTSHIEIANWEDGTTEPASSGSPLFNEDKLVVGQLFGGEASCSNVSYDHYGNLGFSWKAGLEPEFHISTWLDPDNTGVESIEGRYSSGSVGLDVATASISFEKLDPCSRSIQPAVTFRNLGFDIVSQIDYSYQLDNGILQLGQWTGTLNQLEMTEVDLGVLNSTLGDRELKVEILQVNGQDDFFRSNNEIILGFHSTLGESVTVELLTDDWPQETNVIIRDELDQIVAFETNFDANTTYNFSYCLVPGCYSFAIYDGAEDGICCTFGEGSFRITGPDGLLGEGGEFTDFQIINFCVEEKLTAGFAINSPYICRGSNVVFSDVSLGNPVERIWTFEGGTPSTSSDPNPIIAYNEAGAYPVFLEVTDANGTTSTAFSGGIIVVSEALQVNAVNEVCLSASNCSVQLEVSGGQQPYSYEWSTGSTENGLFNVPEGPYDFTVTDANGCISSGTVSLGDVSFGENPDLSQWKVYPSFTNNFITVEGTAKGETSISIFSLDGKLQDYQPFQSNKVVLDVSSLSSGIYLLKVVGEGIEVSRKFVVK